MGRFDLAIAVSEAGLRRHPESPQCHYHIGVACYNLALSGIGTGSVESDGWKKRALSELLVSRDHEEARRLQNRGLRGGPGGLDPPWRDEDQLMIDTLSKKGKLQSFDLREAGWRIFGWRN